MNKKQIHIGYFDTKKEALDARNNYIIKNKLYEYEISPWNNKKKKKSRFVLTSNLK